MFRRKSIPYENVEGIISKGMKITGNISSEGSVRVDGAIEGTLSVKGDMILGETGSVQGDINASNLIVAGKLDGAAVVREKLEITSTGVLLGEVCCSTMVVEEGGILEGTTQMTKKETKVEGAPRKTGAAS